jgi:hypothetical protein
MALHRGSRTTTHISAGIRCLLGPCEEHLASAAANGHETWADFRRLTRLAVAGLLLALPGSAVAANQDPDRIGPTGGVPDRADAHHPLNRRPGTQAHPGAARLDAERMPPEAGPSGQVAPPAAFRIGRHGRPGPRGCRGPPAQGGFASRRGGGGSGIDPGPRRARRPGRRAPRRPRRRRGGRPFRPRRRERRRGAGRGRRTPQTGRAPARTA